jgi:hypothetical protein
MSDWFDTQAARTAKKRRRRRLSPAKRAKIKQINKALGKSDNVLTDRFISIDTFQRGAVKAQSGRVSGSWLDTIDDLRKEALRARDRLERLNTGLRAERRLREALTETAAGVKAWHDAMRTSDLAALERAQARMERHFANANHSGRLGHHDLQRGQ